MSDEELQIWRAAYAAAFAEEFAASGRKHGYSRAELLSAELAVNAADLAVHRLRQWRDAENPKAGRAVSAYWSDK